jgi:hypothetical protein
MQPLDLGFMGSFKTYYAQEIETWLASNPGRAVTPLMVARLFGKAYMRAATMEASVNAYRKTGLVPCNRQWQCTRTPTSKKLLNRVTQDLKQLLHHHKNDGIQKFLHGLTPTASTDYSLWKSTKKLKTVTQPSTPIWTSQGTWAQSNAEKAQAFAHHLASVFQPHPSDHNSIPEATLTSLLETPFQLEPRHPSQTIRGTINK